MNITFEEAIEKYLKYAKLKLKFTTYYTNERKVNQYILKYFKNKNINNLTNEDYIEWQCYINSLSFSYNYKSSLHYCFSDFLNYCIITYNLKNNVAKNIGNFRNDEITKTGDVLTIDEFNKFINVIDNQIYNTLFKFLYFTGCREGEALALTFNDIEDNVVFINKELTRYLDSNKKKRRTTPKTKKSIRKICIDNQLKKEIESLREYYITNYNNYNDNFNIFGGDKDISFTSLRRNKNKYSKLAGVKQITIHQFRHSHAVLLYLNNVPIEQISSRLGHSTISMTTDTYLKYLPKNEKRVITTLNSLRLN